MNHLRDLFLLRGGAEESGAARGADYVAILMLALLFLLVRPQGLFGERIIERV